MPTIATASRPLAGPRCSEAGANAQRPLWASTGTKNLAYSDVLYVEDLIAPDVVNTMPEATLRKFADHGEVGPPLDPESDAPEETLRGAQAAGVDLDSLTAELERDGVRTFLSSYRELVACIEHKLSRPRSVAGARGAGSLGSCS